MSEGFDKIISDCSDIITDNIKTPREVIRFINLFMPKYEKIRYRVNFHDFLMLSLIQYKHYKEYRNLYGERFTQESISEITITNANNEPEKKTLQLLILKDNINIILANDVEDEEKRESLKKLLTKLFEKQDSYNENVFSQIKYREKFKAYFEVLVTKAGANIKNRDEISEAYYNKDLFDEQIFRVGLENALETSILEYLKITTGLDLKDEADLRDYLQKLLWVNKRKVGQIKGIKALILKDSDTAKILQAKIGNYKSIISEEFKKIPPLNILADFVNDNTDNTKPSIIDQKGVPVVDDEVNKIILEQNEIFEIIKAETDINMIEVDGGEFIMNSLKSKRKTKVKSFRISRFQVTQELYRVVMGENPSNFKGQNLPVESSWYDCTEFCNKLSSLCGRTHYYRIDKETKDENNKNEYDKLKWTIEPDKEATGFRLPTEAQWEYAARGGKKTQGYKFSGSNTLDDVGWYSENSGDKKLKIIGGTHEVGAKQPNELGIYDMSGNVWEWCWDWYAEYDKSETINPMGSSSGADRVLRGGCWNYSAWDCEVSDRFYGEPDTSINLVGFRLVLPR